VVVTALQSVSTDATTHLLAQIAVLLGTAFGFGALARKVRQPAVIGYVAAGVVCGPSVFGRVTPGLAGDLFPGDAVTSAMLLGIAGLGSVCLLALTGLEIDLPTVRRWGRLLPGVALGSLLLPMIVGFGLGWILPVSFVGDATTRGGFALLMAIAFGISSPPVMAAVLGDLGLSRREFAHVAMSIAMSNDVVGWVLLGIVVAGASGAGGAGGALLKAAAGSAVLAIAVIVTVRLLHRFGARIPEKSHALVGLAFVAALAAVSSGFGIDAVLGAFVAGLALHALGNRGEHVIGALRPIVHSFLGPLFFAVAGLRVNLADLTTPSVLLWTLLAIVVAVAAKVIGAGVPARLSGRSRSDSLALGAILNVRGSLEIVLAGVGLTAGILTTTSYSVVICVALATSAIASPLLRYALRASDDSTKLSPWRLRMTSRSSGSDARRSASESRG
jgi:Kef-type K+ transport system membrane component KefB